MTFPRFAAVAVLAVSQLASSARSQLIPLGSEFQINTYTTDGQYQPAVAASAAGSFVVVWTTANEAYETGDIRGQRYDASGVAIGEEFPVNTYTTSDQNHAAVASDAAGNFVVVWASNGSPESDRRSYSIQARRFDASGAPLGGQFQVNTYTTGTQRYPRVASDGAGSFLVVWASTGSAETDRSESVQARRYDGTGTPLGCEFQVNTFTTDGQYFPAVAADPAGNFLVVWTSDESAGATYSFRVQGQRYDASGAVGAEFQVNSSTYVDPYGLGLAADHAGNFVVVWQGAGRIQGQRLDATGAALGTEFQVATYTTTYSRRPAIAADAAGNLLVVWQGDDAPPSDPISGIKGRGFDSSGAPLGGDFRVNTYTTEFQFAPTVATGPAGNFIVAWTSSKSSGSDQDFLSVQGQRFGWSNTTSTTSSGPATTSTTLATTHLLPGHVAIVRPGTLAKFVAKPVCTRFALPRADPIAEGGSLRIFDTGGTAGDDSHTLPLGARWKGLGTPAGSKGYRYTGAGTPSDPCKVVLVKETVIKAICQGSGVTLTPPFTGDVGIVLSLGTSDRYCAQFGGDVVKNTDTRTKRKNATAPRACP